jgi:hypothetical protein
MAILSGKSWLITPNGRKIRVEDFKDLRVGVRVCRNGALEVGKITTIEYIGFQKECGWIRCGRSAIVLPPDQMLLSPSGDIAMSDIKVGTRLLTNGIFLYKDEAWLRKRHAEGRSLSSMAAECGVDKKSIICALRNIGIIHENYRRRPIALPGGWPRQAKVYRKRSCTFAKRVYVVKSNTDHIIVNKFIVKDVK